MPMGAQTHRPVGGAGGDRARIRVSARTTAVIRGEDDVTTWDDEELRRGRRRSDDGRFYGRDPAVLPRVCFEEMYRRVIATAERELLTALPDVVRALLAIIDDPDTTDSTKLRAIEMVLDRVMGKAVDRSQVAVEVTRQPWQDALVAGIVATEEEVAEVIDVKPEPEDVEWD